MLKNYANKHPKNKESSQDKNIKVAKVLKGKDLNKFYKSLYSDYKKDMNVQGKRPTTFDKYMEKFPKEIKDYRK